VIFFRFSQQSVLFAPYPIPVSSIITVFTPKMLFLIFTINKTVLKKTLTVILEQP